MGRFNGHLNDDDFGYFKDRGLYLERENRRKIILDSIIESIKDNLIILSEKLNEFRITNEYGAIEDTLWLFEVDRFSSTVLKKQMAQLKDLNSRYRNTEIDRTDKFNYKEWFTSIILDLNNSKKNESSPSFQSVSNKIKLIPSITDIKEKYSIALHNLETISIPLLNAIAAIFKEYKKDEYASEPEHFIHEMIGLYIWRIAVDTTIPRDGEYNELYSYFIKELGDKINPQNSSPEIWCQFNSTFHQILEELSLLGLQSNRSNPWNYDEINDLHVNKCKLNEASDLLIAAYLADGMKSGSFLKLTIESLKEISNCLMKINPCSKIKRERVNKQLTESFNDIPPKLFLQWRKLGPRTINLILSDLNEYIGLSVIKEKIESLINFMKIQKIRIENNLNVHTISNHLVFIGNPGTGKTTVARLLSEGLASIGCLSKGHLVEVDRSDLVAGYVGQTAIKTKQVCKKALGGILFIDEAYALLSESKDSDFGEEAVEVLLKFMEDNRNDFIIILAGYPKEMEKMLRMNPGLLSRFSQVLTFPDYSIEELVEIFCLFLKKSDYILDEASTAYLTDVLRNIKLNCKNNFGNARDARNLFEKTLINHSSRLNTKASINKADLITIKIDDIANSI